MSTGSLRRRALWICALLALAAVLVALPFVLYPAQPFAGSDDKAAEVIAQMPSAGRPWFHPLWQPGSEHAKNVLFILQAALGMVVLGVCLVALRRRQRKTKSQTLPEQARD